MLSRAQSLDKRVWALFRHLQVAAALILDSHHFSCGQAFFPPVSIIYPWLFSALLLPHGETWQASPLCSQALRLPKSALTRTLCFLLRRRLDDYLGRGLPTHGLFFSPFAGALGPGPQSFN